MARKKKIDEKEQQVSFASLAEIEETTPKEEMKIVAGEDNKTLLDSIMAELSKHFYVEACEDGEEALYMIEQGIYDLVVLDLMLPGMNGMEILKNARNKGMEFII